MRARLVIVAALVVTCTLLLASPAMGAQQTRILYGLENLDYYTYTPTATGYLQIEVFWQDDTGGTPGYPVAQVDGVCQAWNAGEGEAYWDYKLKGLYANTNPEDDVLEITAAMVGKPVYVGVLPSVGDVQYSVLLGWSTRAIGPFSTVLDSGFSNDRRAHGIDAKFFIPAIAGATTPWHSVAIWPGSSGGTQYADVDDHCYNYDSTTTIANNFESTDHYGPLVTDAEIAKESTGDWFIAAPQVRTAAAVPNDWTGGSIYPKPGTLAYDTAPIWYTYSWGEDAGTSNTAYFWSVGTNASASRLSYSGDSSTVAKISYSFYGPSCTWVYRTGALGGKANIYIDGSATPYNGTPISLYSATTQWKKEYAVTGLSNAAHTLEIRNAGTTESPAKGFFIYHDSFKASGFSGDSHTHSENNMDGMTLYDWSRVSNAGASGGDFSGNPSTTSAAAFTFSGTSVDFIFRTGPLGGKAKVYIDGLLQPDVVNMYSASTVWQVTKSYTGLSPGMHTLLIQNAGTTDSPDKGFFVYIDAFRVGGTLYQN